MINLDNNLSGPQCLVTREPKTIKVHELFDHSHCMTIHNAFSFLLQKLNAKTFEYCPTLSHLFCPIFLDPIFKVVFSIFQADDVSEEEEEIDWMDDSAWTENNEDEEYHHQSSQRQNYRRKPTSVQSLVSRLNLKITYKNQVDNLNSVSLIEFTM